MPKQTTKATKATKDTKAVKATKATKAAKIVTTLTKAEITKLFKSTKRKRLNATEKQLIIDHPEIINGHGENLLHNYAKHDGVDLDLISDMVANGHTFDNYNKVTKYGPIMSCISFCHNTDIIYKKIYHMIGLGCPLCSDDSDFTELLLIDYLNEPGNNSYYLVNTPEFPNFIKYLVSENILETDLTKEKYRYINPMNIFKNLEDIKWFIKTFKVYWDIGDENKIYGRNGNISFKSWNGSYKECHNPLYFFLYMGIINCRYQTEDSDISEHLEIIKYILDNQLDIYKKKTNGKGRSSDFINKYIDYQLSENNSLIGLILSSIKSDEVLFTIRTWMIENLNNLTEYDDIYGICYEMNCIFEYIFKIYIKKIYRGLTDHVNHIHYFVDYKELIIEYDNYEAIQVKKNILFALKYGYSNYLPIELIRILGITYEEVVDSSNIIKPFIINNIKYRPPFCKGEIGENILTNDEYSTMCKLTRYYDVNNMYLFPDDDGLRERQRKDFIKNNPGIEKFTRTYCEEQIIKINKYSAKFLSKERKEKEKQQIKIK